MRCKDAQAAGWTGPCPPWPHHHKTYTLQLTPEEVAEVEAKLKPNPSAFTDKDSE